MTRSSLLRLALGLLFVSSLTSCDTTFRKAWKNAPASHSVEGRWEGTWKSSTSGKSGPLLCAIDKPIPGRHDILDYVAAEGRVSTPVPRCFYYHAARKGPPKGSFTSRHDVRRLADGSIVFAGRYFLSKRAGGWYEYEGTIRGDDFTACYHGAKDSGTFTLRRVP